MRGVLRTVQGAELDLSTSAGRMVARILGSVARQGSENPHTGQAVTASGECTGRHVRGCW
ncbi:hypothetical protein FPZ47_26510 [Mycobacterium helveticum]|uniref:Uncharacterized protein n=1 Tax=Mycobacterium helveticum TaxID=2592811 RepID=A0A557WWN5_9MYCO|nr:hypothetical protein FPZ46_26530 [Mycobacterium helveticum]TVS77679.1 hypothetical protein FPZ47_26510 [Mycobacterium helveticum]